MIFEGEYEAALQARMPGVTEEMVRAGIEGGLLGGAVVGALNDMGDESAAQLGAFAVGVAAGPSAAAFNARHELLLSDWPTVAPYADRGLDDGENRGKILGALGAGLAGLTKGNLSDVEAGVIGSAVGATAAFTGAATLGRVPESADSPEMIGAFDQLVRRRQAMRGMMRMNFNRFMAGLNAEHLVNVRRAVPCAELNPDGLRGPAVRLSSDDRVAYDCHVARYRDARW